MSDDDPDCYGWVADCRLRAVTELLAHTWDPLVLAALRTGARRRRELRAAIGTISDKVLTGTLHRLQANGLITRTAHAEAPPRVEYALSPLGRTLVDGPLTALGQWITDHGEALLEAQDRAAGDPAISPAGCETWRMKQFSRNPGSTKGPVTLLDDEGTLWVLHRKGADLRVVRRLVGDAGTPVVWADMGGLRPRLTTAAERPGLWDRIKAEYGGPGGVGGLGRCRAHEFRAESGRRMLYVEEDC